MITTCTFDLHKGVDLYHLRLVTRCAPRLKQSFEKTWLPLQGIGRSQRREDVVVNQCGIAQIDRAPPKPCTDWRLEIVQRLATTESSACETSSFRRIVVLLPLYHTCGKVSEAFRREGSLIAVAACL
jgi:hypothetical protein